MKRIYCLLLTANCLLVFSCGQKPTPIMIPANIIQKEKMACILTDIHLEEAKVKLRSLSDSAKKDSLNFKKIFAKDTITKQQYEESLNFYIDHPELLNNIYQEVVNELTKMQGTPGKQ